jgi:hypothetical protein
MKAYTIALFLFILQVSAAILATQTTAEGDPLFRYDTTLDDSPTINGTAEAVRQGSYNQTGQGEQDYEPVVGTDFISFGKNLFRVGTTLEAFGVPPSISWIFAAPVYVIWSIALIQFFWRKGFKDMV